MHTQSVSGRVMLHIDIKKRLFGSEGEFTLRLKQDVNRGDFIVIMGESGSGKTTLLRIVAGLERAEGEIFVDEEVWLERRFSLPIQKRNVGFVFQDYALFDNLSVKENLLFVNPDDSLARRLMEMTGIAGLSSRNVRRLSGGQKQRVALARALMRRPKLLLMDEPFSALDPRMRKDLREKIRRLHAEFGTTTLMVSHDIIEAKHLADSVWFVDKKVEPVAPDSLEKLLYA